HGRAHQQWRARRPLRADGPVHPDDHSRHRPRRRCRKQKPRRAGAGRKLTMTNVLTQDFKHQPYWWDAAPLEALETADTRRDFDVAIVGSGFTGLVAALALLRGGRSVVIFEKELAGFGASRRNAGFLGRVLKKSYGELEKGDGQPYAHAVYSELNA